jgi:hypothetical protein
MAEAHSVSFALLSLHETGEVRYEIRICLRRSLLVHKTFDACDAQVLDGPRAHASRRRGSQVITYIWDVRIFNTLTCQWTLHSIARMTACAV